VISSAISARTLSRPGSFSAERSSAVVALRCTADIAFQATPSRRRGV
jgi:hypothetical protein